MQRAGQLVSHYSAALHMRHRECSAGDVVHATSRLASESGEGATGVASSGAGFIAQRIYRESNGNRSGAAPGLASGLFGAAVSEVERAQRGRVYESTAGVPGT